MFDWDGILPRTYELSLEIGDEVRHLKYEEYSAYETLEFANSNIDVFDWLYNFLNEHLVEWDNITKKYLKKIDWGEIYKKILGHLHWDYFSIDEEWDKSISSDLPYPIAAYITFLSQKLSLDPLKMLQTYSFRQLQYLTDGVRRNLREETEKGREKNKKISRKKRNKKLKEKNIDKVFDYLSENN